MSSKEHVETQQRIELETKIRCAFYLLDAAVSDYAYRELGDVDDQPDIEESVDFPLFLPRPMLGFTHGDDPVAWFVPGKENEFDKLIEAIVDGIQDWKGREE